MKKLFAFTATALLIIISQTAKAQTTLSAGDVALAGINSDNPDKFSIVLLKNIVANTVINFTDNGFTGNNLTGRTGEGFLTYTAPSAKTAGTILSWTNGMSIAGTGWNSNGPSNFSFNASGDQLFIFQGNSSNWASQSGITLLFGINYGTALSGTSSAANTLQPNTSILPATAWINFPSAANANGYFANGSSSTSSVTVSGTSSALLALIVNTSKWFGNWGSAATFPTWNITVCTFPTSVTASSNSPVCAGSIISLSGSATGATSYSWAGPGSFSSSSQNPTRTNAPTAYSGTYTLTATNSCGSTTATTSVTVNPLSTVGANASAATVCVGTSVTLTGTGASTYAWTGGVSNGVGFIPSATTTYTVTGTDSHGCTNTAIKTITVNPLPTVGANAGAATVCVGTSVTLTGTGASTYAWTGGVSNGVGFIPSATTTYTVTGTDANGCTNTATKTITIKNNSSSTINQTACNSYLWNAATYTTSGTYTYHTTNASGCDSVVTLNLTINNSSSSTTTQTACNSYLWNATTYTASGTYTYNTSNAAGCDSTATLNLTINHSSSSATNQTACNSYLWNASTYTATGTYTYNTTNASGCDSTATLNLTINHSSSSTTNQTACNSYLWNATTYTASGTYTYNTSNASGCDSTATLNLTINNSSSSTTNQTACNSYLWNATTYTASGTYTHNTTNSAGCDSTATLELTINTPPAQPGIFTAKTTFVYQGQNAVVYTVPNNAAATYTWSFSGTGATINGTGNSVTIDYSPTATSGTLSVTANNSCGASTARTLAISLNTPITVPTTNYDYSFVTLGCNRVDYLDTTFTTADPDYSCGASTANVYQLKRVFTEIAHLNPLPKFLIMTGDIVMGYLTPSTPDTTALAKQLTAWKAIYESHPLSSMGITLIAVPGNHETQDKAAGKHSFVSAEKIFTRIMAPYIHGSNGPGAGGPDGLATDQSKLTYSFDYGGDHYIIIDTDPVGKDGITPYHWIAGDIRTARASHARHIFAFGHKPAYSSPYTPQGGLDAASTLAQRDSLWKYLENNNCEAMFSAHEHLWDSIHPHVGKTWQVINGDGGTRVEVPWVGPGKQYYGYTLVNLYTDRKVNVMGLGRNTAMSPTVGTAYPINEDSSPTTVRNNFNICLTTTSSTSVTACDHYAWNATTYTTSGTYTYTTTNAAGCDSVATLALVINPNPAQPAAFTASTATVTAGTNSVVYTVPNDASVTYSWSYTGTGATIHGTGNSVTVDFSTSATNGTLSVTASNVNCGPSAARTIAITVIPLTNFTTGNLVVIQTAGSVSKGGSAVTLKEYTTTGTAGISVAIPATGATPLQMAAGPGGSEGFLTRSTDGGSLMLGGYSTSTTGIADITATTSSSTPRVIFKIDAAGNYTQVGSSSTNYSANDIRGAISDGTNSWASGASVANVDGIDYYGPGTPAALGTGATPVKAYGLQIFNGQIYYSTQKAGPANTASHLGIFSLGSGLPTSGNPASTQIIDVGATNVPTDFSLNAAGNVCYIAINLNTSAGGIQKWTKSGSVWSLAYTLGTGVANIGAYGLVVDYSGANPVIYATTFEANTTGNRIVKITDTGAGSAATTLATTPANSWFHGISFAPVPVSCTTVSIASQPVSPSPLCSGSGTAAFAVAVNGTAPFTYQWQENSSNINDGGVYAGTGTATLIITNPTIALNGKTYRCVVTNCTNNTATTNNLATLTINNAPAVTASASNTTICAGQNSTLTASGTDTYVWQPGGATTSSITVMPTVTTTYTVIGTVTGYPVACSSSNATVTINVNTIPAQPGAFTASSTSVLRGQNGVVYTVPSDPSFTSYAWSYSGTGATINGSGNSVTIDFSLVATAGTLSVTATNSCGTSVARSLGITINTSFNAGNLVVLQTSGTASKVVSPITLKEITTSGATGISVTIPSGSNNATPFQTSGVFGGSEGFLTTSTDNKFLVLGGYSTSATTGDVTATSSANVPRAVGLVYPSGFFQEVGSSTINFSGNDIRGAISDGTNFWASGASVAGVDGIDYYGPGTSAGLGTDAIAPPKAYGLRIFNGQIYYSTQKAGPFNDVNHLGIFSLGSGTPTSGTPTPTQIINTGTTVVEDFSINPATDVCYIAVNLNTSAGGIQKWTKTAGVWSLAYTLGTGIANRGAYGLVVDYSGANPVIYATTFDATGNRVIKITDTGAGSAATTLVAAVANVFYKGIAFAPVASGTPIVNLSVSTITGSEAGTTTVTVTANTSSAVTGNQTVSLGISGTGITAGDYILSNSTITIPDGTTNGSVTFTVVDDANVEAIVETAVLTISNPSAGIVLGSSLTQNIAITDNEGDYPPTIVMDVTSTSNFIDGGVSASPASPFSVSSTSGDPTDPATTLGIDFTISDLETAAGSLTVTATSSNTVVVPNSNITITGTGASRNVKITPVDIGYSNISVSVFDGYSTVSYVIYFASSEVSGAFANTRWHTGMSDASDAVPIDDSFYMTGDDELDVINIYSRSSSGLPVKSFDVASFLNLPDPGKPEVDTEAGTGSHKHTGRTYWMGSMSNGKAPFDSKPNRDRIFATTHSGTGAATTLSFAGYCSIKTPLLAWGDANGYNFSASAAAGVDAKSPAGFSAEGMVFGPDSTTLWIGLRAPLVPTIIRTRAVIAPILDFETWFNNGAPSGSPAFGSPIELDLGTRGIGDIIRLSNGTYIILASSPLDDASYNVIFKWTGNPADAPVLVGSSANNTLNMEGVMQVNDGGNLSLSKLQIVTDYGEYSLYHDGIEAKDFGDLNLRKFRSDVLTSLDLCIGIATPTITAGGNTSFCPGGSVVLSAPDNMSSYLWSNGATTQSITAGVSGNYYIIVTNNAGCTATSSTVEVNVIYASEDINRDGIVSQADLNLLYLKFGIACTCSEDINGDGIVSQADLNLLYMKFGTSCH